MSVSAEQIFVSSTHIGLVDLRAEVRNLLLEVGVTPLLAEHAEFGVGHSVNAIETCLERVKRCDTMICIIDSRYGDALDAFGYPGISATHLEYNTAVELKKPIFLFIRETVKADWSSWTKNNRNSSLTYNSITEQKDVEKIFQWISDHESRKAKNDNNWITSFRDSLEVKNRIRSLLNVLAPRTIVEQALRDGFIPPLVVTWGYNPSPVEYMGKRSSKVQLGIYNLGKHSAFDCTATAVGWKPERDMIGPIAPGKTPSTVLVPTTNGRDYPEEVVLTFTTVQGYRILQTYKLSAQNSYGALSDISLASHHTFTIGAKSATGMGP